MTSKLIGVVNQTHMCALVFLLCDFSYRSEFIVQWMPNPTQWLLALTAGWPVLIHILFMYKFCTCLSNIFLHCKEHCPRVCALSTDSTLHSPKYEEWHCLSSYTIVSLWDCDASSISRKLIWCFVLSMHTSTENKNTLRARTTGKGKTRPGNDMWHRGRLHLHVCPLNIHTL